MRCYWARWSRSAAWLGVVALPAGAALPLPTVILAPLAVAIGAAPPHAAIAAAAYRSRAPPSA
jgi:hypothetical protein